MEQLAGFDFALVYWVARMVASFFAYSFAGWLFEVIISLFQHHRFVDRGFSFGPVCPIYGVGALLAVLFLSHLTDPLVQFVVGFFAAGVLEFSTSWVMERMFHARWWDYSNIPLNINGRICVPGLLLFSSLMLCVNFFAQPALESLFDLVPAQVLVMVTTAASVVFAVDLTASFIHMRGMLEKVRGIQGVVSDLSERAHDALDSLVDFKDGLMENIKSIADPAVREELQIKLRGAWRDTWSGYERKSMRDPRFRFTQYGETFEMLRRVRPWVKKKAADVSDSLTAAASKAVGREDTAPMADEGPSAARNQGQACPAESSKHAGDVH